MRCRQSNIARHTSCTHPHSPPPGAAAAAAGALLFCGYLVFDTQLLIQRLDLDDYIWAAVQIYLDVVNLFLYILRLLGQQRE